jgi:hypothetical protein
MGLYSAGGLLVLGLVALGTFGFAQAPRPEGGQQYYPDQPGTRPGGPAGKQAAKFASKGIEDEDVPYDHLPSQAVVRIEEGKLVIRQRAKHIEVKSPVGEANSPFESPYKLRSVVSGQTFADPGELAVFDMKGNRLLPKVWKDKLKVDTHVLLAYDGKTPNPRELTLLREDVLLIILPAVSHPPYQYGAPSPAASLPYRPSSFVPAPAVHPPSSYPAVVPPVDVGDPLPSISVGPTQSTFPPSPAVNPLPPASQTLPPSTNPGVHSNRNQERRSSPPSSMENTPSDSAVSAKS